jgi:hypothetical protein
MLRKAAMAKRPTKAGGFPKPSSGTSGGRRGVHLERAELVRDLALAFKDAHEYGTRALHARDLKTFSQAIAVERRLIGEHRAMVEGLHDEIKTQREVIHGIRHATKLKAHKTKRIGPRKPGSSTSEAVSAMLHTPPLPAEKKASKKRTHQTEGPSMSDVDDEHRQLLEEQDVLQREHAFFVEHPHDFEGHEAHRLKLRQHIRKLRGHIARIQEGKKKD